jgi:hypothetical protein
MEGVMLPLLITAAFAGYGDAKDGYPTANERLLHLWTNVARVAPGDFTAAYARGGCGLSDFQPSERTPKAPLAIQHALNVVARDHSEDMASTGVLSHNSSDGTSFGERVWDVYPGSGIGENVAAGYPDVETVVFQGWMCSSGHRENIMSPEWDELGVGIKNKYYTQDFGTRNINRPVMTMGAHDPVAPRTSAEFYVDVTSSTPPSSVSLVLNGATVPMALAWGTTKQGVYRAQAATSSGCYVYWFTAQIGASVERFPEDGAYGFGDCAFDDPAAQWIAGENLSDAGGGAGTGDAGGGAGGGSGDGGLWPGSGDTGADAASPGEARGCDHSGRPSTALAAWAALIAYRARRASRREGHPPAS